MSHLHESFQETRKRRHAWKERKHTSGGQSSSKRGRSTRVGAFEQGSVVEYWSESKKLWLTSMVVRCNSDRTYDLTVKNRATESCLREAFPFVIGEHAMFCADRGKNEWCPVVIVAQHLDGTYDIEMWGEAKKKIKLEYLRHTSSAANNGADSGGFVDDGCR